MITRISGRVVLLHLKNREGAGDDEQRRADIKRDHHRLRHHARRCRVGETDIGEHERQHGGNHRTGIGEKTLNTVGITLLLVVNHIADHHLERLHCHVGRHIQQGNHQRAKYQRGKRAKAETAGVRHQNHDQHGNQCAIQQIRQAAATETRCPSAVRIMADDGLYQKTRQRRQDKEPAETVRVSAECLENAAHLRALQGEGRLHAEKAEADHPDSIFGQRGQALLRRLRGGFRHKKTPLMGGMLLIAAFR